MKRSKIRTLVIAAILLLSFILVPSVLAQDPIPEVSIYDIQHTTDPGGVSPYDDQTVTTQGVVTAVLDSGKFIWIQDGTGPWKGLYLYQATPATIPSPGDQVDVTGLVDEYWDLTELIVDSITVTSSGNPIPAPEVLSSSAANDEQWEGVFVRVENATVTDDDIGYGEWEIDDGSGPVDVDNIGVYSYSPTNGDLLDFVQGPLHYTYDEFKIAARDDSDIQVNIPPTPTPPPVTITPIYDIQYPGGNSPYVGQTITTQGVVTAAFGDGQYTIQDGQGEWSGLFLYYPDPPPAVGDLIQVTGEIKEYYGLTEMIDGVVIANNPGTLPSPEVLTTAEVGQEQWESVLVRVEMVTVIDDDLGYGEWSIDDGSGVLRVDDLGYPYSPTVGEVLDYVQGPLYYGFGDYKIEPRNSDDLAVYIPPPPVVTIMEIQGSDQFSPYDGQVVETSGVVTLYTANGENLWLQDPDGDGDPGTSDGIYVSGGGNPGEGPAPAVGDHIRIIAKVEEQQYPPALPLTRLRNVELIEALSSGNPLPEPVELEDLPNESIAEGIAFWEPLEGMLVEVNNAPVVSSTSYYGEFCLLTKDDAKPGSGFYPEAKQILIRDLGDNEVDYNPERILVDDSSLSTAINAMAGDRMRSFVGVVDFTFGNYKLQPVSYDINNHKLPKLPASTRSGGKGDLVITSFNVENLFDLVTSTNDVFGQIGVDPGSSWGSGSTSAKDNTLRRKDGICQGDNNGFNHFDPVNEWDGFDKDTFDDLGTYTTSCPSTLGLFISEYIEGSSNNKAIEIYNGTGIPIDLGYEAYAIDFYFNGYSTPFVTIPLTGVIANNDVFVLADEDADPVILAVADQTSSSSFFNGDDVIVLRKGSKDDADSTPSPDELETQLAKLALAIEIELELPEIIVLQEIENQAIAQVLGDRVNASAGTNYQAVSFETSDARGIEPGFLWDADRVDLLNAFQMTGPDVEAAFGPTSPSPGREPIVGIFEYKGKEFTIVGNHFKSKGGDDAIFGVTWPPTRITEVQRKAQAQVVRDYVDTILDADPDALVMVAGDLNDFQFGEPGEGPDHPIAILEGYGGGMPLTNLINLEKDDERFTYIYDGNSQVLDHMLVSPAFMSRLTGTDVLHFNAGYRSSLGDDPSTPLRSSDHDPLEGRFSFKK